VGKQCSEREGAALTCVCSTRGDVSELGERDSGERAARTERRQSLLQVLARPGEGAAVAHVRVLPSSLFSPVFGAQRSPQSLAPLCVVCTRARGCCSKTERRQVGSACVPTRTPCSPSAAGPTSRLAWTVSVCHLPGPLWGGPWVEVAKRIEDQRKPRSVGERESPPGQGLLVPHHTLLRGQKSRASVSRGPAERSEAGHAATAALCAAQRRAKFTFFTCPKRCSCQARARKASAPTKAAGVPLLGKGKNQQVSHGACLAGRDWVSRAQVMWWWVLAAHHRVRAAEPTLFPPSGG
jgi:hypothetical protein